MVRSLVISSRAIVVLSAGLLLAACGNGPAADGGVSSSPAATAVAVASPVSTPSYAVPATPATPTPAATTRPTVPPAPAVAKVFTRQNMRLGRVLVNASGRTLYYFVPERGGRVVCSGTCTTFWPPLLNSGAAPAAGGALPGLLGLIGRPGGSQITYNRWPLYTYSGDLAPDQTNGQGIVAFGGSWFVATPGLSG